MDEMPTGANFLYLDYTAHSSGRHTTNKKNSHLLACTPSVTHCQRSSSHGIRCAPEHGKKTGSDGIKRFRAGGLYSAGQTAESANQG